VLSQLPARTDTTVWVEMSDAQRIPYREHQHTLAGLLGKKYLGETDRRRILACLTNLRMVCDSTYLLDRQTNSSPKLEEFEELLAELISRDLTNKVVVFSQWEMMVQLAADIARKYDPNFAVLHGSLPGPERRRVLEKFRDDPACRVFLSTDAGGTGLNLQAADTVINLEMPWNPAVLEQRIARVHRMGQHLPVQVYNFVMRDSIEERVLAVLDQKRALFDELFTGTSDEIAIDGMGQQAFLDAMRDLFAPPEPEPPAPLPIAEVPTTAPERPIVPDVFLAGVAFLEALAASIDKLPPLPPDLAARGVAALEAIAKAIRRP
jgi:SNF2 family DNA or RNA helicase